MGSRVPSLTPNFKSDIFKTPMKLISYVGFGGVGWKPSGFFKIQISGKNILKSRFPIKFKILCLAFIMILAALSVFGQARGIAWGDSASSGQYSEAKKYFYSLINSKANKSQRQNWLAVIHAFKEILKKYPESAEAPKASFTIGRLYHRMGKALRNSVDMETASQHYRNLVKNFPAHRLSDDALIYLSDIYLQRKNYSGAQDIYLDIIENFSSGDQLTKAKSRLRKMQSRVSKASAKSAHALVVLHSLHWTNEAEGIQVTLKADGLVNYQQRRLKDPARLVLDFENIRWQKNTPKEMVVNGRFLRRVQTRTASPSQLILELESFQGLQIQTYQQKDRLVIDLRKSMAKNVAVKPRKSIETVSAPAPKKSKGIPLIVVDAGHGGKDYGAKGYSGLWEKHLNLTLAKRLKEVLEKRYKYSVWLTRDADTFIGLKQRGEMANKIDADLFVSIHANAAERRSAKGFETYYLGTASSERAIETAARENGELVHSVEDDVVQQILASLISTTKINASSRLAAKVQNKMSKTLSRKFSDVRNLGVKEGPFFVLHQTSMPSILIEVGFVTNAMEEKRLKSRNYQYWLADSIARGIHEFLQEKAPSI